MEPSSAGRPRGRFGSTTSTMVRLPGYADFLEKFDPGIRQRHAVFGAPPGFSECIAWIQPLAGGDATPHWSVTFTVDDTDGIAARSRELGGTVLVEPYDIPPVRSSRHPLIPRGRYSRRTASTPADRPRGDRPGCDWTTTTLGVTGAAGGLGTRVIRSLLDIGPTVRRRVDTDARGDRRAAGVRLVTPTSRTSRRCGLPFAAWTP